MKSILTIMLFWLTTTLVVGQNEYPLEIVIQKGHVKPVTCVAFSPNGKYIATGSKDNSIKLWNAKTGKEIRSFNNHTGYIQSLFFSKDGIRLLSTGGDNKIVIQQIITGKQENVFTVDKDRLMKAVFSPGEYKILAANDKGLYWVFDVSSGEKKGPFKKSYESTIHSNWFGNENQTLEFYNYKESHIIDCNSNNILQKIEFDKASSYSFSPDGKYITIGSTKLFAETFETSTGKKTNTLLPDKTKKCDGCNTVVRYSNSGKYILTGAKKSGVFLWNNKGVIVKTLNADLVDRIRYMSFSLNDKFIVVTTDKNVFIYDVKSGNLKLEFKNKWLSRFEPTFSLDEKNIILPGENNTTEIWNILSKRKQKILKGYLNKNNDNGLNYSYNDWASQNILKFLNMKSSVAISPTQPYFVRGNTDSSFVLVNWKTGKIEKKFNGHNKVVFCYDFSPDGKVLVTGGGDSYLKLWDIESGNEIRTFKGHQDFIFDVKFSNDGNQIISGSWDGSMIIWDVAKGSILQRIKLDNTSPYVVGFTPNDLYAVSGDLGKQVRYWETDAGKEFRSIIGNTDILGAFDFSPDSKNMVTACWDGKIKIWDVRTGMLIQKFTEHNGAATSVIYHPNREQIISGGSDRTIYIWNFESKRITHKLVGHTATITDLKVTQNGKILISCSSDGVIKFWDLKTFQELYTYLQIDSENWLVTNPKGYFDGSAKSQQLVNYVSGLEVVPIGSLFNKYYTPNLLKRIMQGEQFEETGQDINQEIKSSPIVRLGIKEENGESFQTSTDSVYVLRDKTFQLNLFVSGEKSNENKVRIFNNGKLIINESLSSEISFRGGEKTTKAFEIDLNDGTNNLSAVVINSKGVESSPVAINVFYDGKKSLTDLYIMVIGINDYKKPSYQLNYAVNDAKSFLKAITKGSDSLFHTINEYVLLNDKANKPEMVKTFEMLSKEVGPEDVFLFYYAGHGVMRLNKNDGSQFFLVPYDITNLYGDEKMMQEKALSAEELLEYSRLISAEKQLFVLDACQSGAALTSFAQRGASREKALAQLARSTGTFFLTASQDIEYANEAGDLKHGLFTYAILEVLKGKVSNTTEDRKVTVNEIKGYVEERVPELSEQYHGTAQYPTSYSFGQDFPIVMIKR